MNNEINVNILKQEWFTYEEMESIKKWLNNIKEWKTLSYNDVKKQAKNKIFSKKNSYV